MGYSMECMCFSLDNRHVRVGGTLVLLVYLPRMKSSVVRMRHIYYLFQIYNIVRIDHRIRHLHRFLQDMPHMPSPNSSLPLIVSVVRTYNSSLPGNTNVKMAM